MVANRFFAAVVRIQSDRDHKVVTGGPYRVVRHPGYAGGIWAWLATPLMLGTLWAYIPALLTIAAMVVRTALEDQTLHSELPGYAEYAQHTRYRLLPGVW
jgi:protein-S-isoprenylcysteine O-methyltransferase Ste14